jgi:peptidoglycan/LPS O-acetylase OafA/YrhL
MLPTNSQTHTSKLLGLEILRFISALAVLIWHYQHFSFVGTHSSDFVREAQPFYQVLWPFYDHGLLGVQIFWAISGYIFFWKYRLTIADRRISGQEFLLLRFSRLYPLHFATLLIVAALQFVMIHVDGRFFVYRQNNLVHFIAQLAMASEWGLTPGPGFNGPIWSISLEVLVYFLFFYLMRIFGAAILPSVLILAASVVIVLYSTEISFADCVAFFFLGGLTAVTDQVLRERGNGFALNTILVPIAVVAPVIALRYQFFDKVFLLAWLPLLLHLCAIDFRVSHRRARLIAIAGNMTYASYLTHFPLQLIIKLTYLMLGIPIPMYDAWLFVGFMLAVMIISYFVFEYFEAPAQKIIRQWWWRKKPVLAEATG